MQRWIHWSTAQIFFLSLIVPCLAVYPVAAASNGTETIITTDTRGSFQQNPSIDNTRIVWDDQRSGLGMNTIYSYDLATGQRIPGSSRSLRSLSLADRTFSTGELDRLAAGRIFRYAIVAFNNATLETFSIPAVPRDTGGYSYYFEPSDNVLPRSNGTAVVWQDFTNNPVWGISLDDLLQGPSGVPGPYPRQSGGTIRKTPIFQEIISCMRTGAEAGRIFTCISAATILQSRSPRFPMTISILQSTGHGLSGSGPTRPPDIPPCIFTISQPGKPASSRPPGQFSTR